MLDATSQLSVSYLVIYSIVVLLTLYNLFVHGKYGILISILRPKNGWSWSATDQSVKRDCRGPHRDWDIPVGSCCTWDLA